MTASAPDQAGPDQAGSGQAGPGQTGPDQASRRVAVLLNPKSGGMIGRDPDTLAAKIEKTFTEAGHAVTVKSLPGQDIAAAVAEAREAGAWAVLVGGGDGTVAAAAQELAGSETALGILPLGTMNLLAKDLKVPLDLDQAIAALANAVTTRIDIGAVNGRVFLANGTLGLVPMVGAERENQRGMPWWRKLPALGGAVWRAMARFPGLALTMEIEGGDGEKRPSRRLYTRSLTIANNAYDDGIGGDLLARSCLDAGRLAIYLLTQRSRLGMVRFGVGLMLGLWQRDPELEVLEATAVTLLSRRRRLAVSLDGEVARLPTPLRFEIRPKALLALTPEGTRPAVANPPPSDAARGSVRNPD